MRIVIIGAGSAGRHLMHRLCLEGHDVIMIDRDQSRLDAAAAQDDILTVLGEGASPTTLEEAEIHKADLLAAVTNADEVNVLACLYARQAGVKHRVARISDQAHFDPRSRLPLSEAGVSLVVNKTQTIAQELFNILRLPGTIEVIELLGGRAEAVGVKLGLESPLLRGPLATVASPERLAGMRVLAAMRGDELIVPDGNTTFLVGDDVYTALPADGVNDYLDWASPSRPGFSKVLIGGGGDLGLALARMLETLPLQVVIMESEAARAEYCSATLDKTLVMHGDALDEEMLEEVGITEGTAFVASTGSDEHNIISCLLAERLGASLTLAQIGKLEYVSIINAQSLVDRAVSPQIAMTNAILHFVRGRNIDSVTLLHGLPGELIELTVPAACKGITAPIKSLTLPKRAVIAAIERDGELLIPTGDLKLMPGDRLAAFAHPSALRKLASIFHAPGRPRE